VLTRRPSEVDHVLELGVAAVLSALAASVLGTGTGTGTGAGSGAVAGEGAWGLAVFAAAAVTPALIRHDLLTRRLPNALVGILAAALVASSVIRGVQQGPFAALAPWGWAALCFVAGFALAVGGMLGMGDVKLGAVLVGAIAPWGGMAVGALVGGAGALGLATAAGMFVARRLRGRRELEPGPVPVPVPVPVPERSRDRDEGHVSRRLVADSPPRAAISSARAASHDPGVPFGPCLLVSFWSLVVIATLS
jgi:Flp pilus assembly protein protease CpaA